MNRFNAFVTLVLSLAMCISISAPVGASEVHVDAIALTETVDCITLIEQELDSQQIDVVTGLNNYKAKLQQILQDSSDEDDSIKLQDLISGVDKLSSAYTAYKNGTRSTNGIYAAAIAAVVTYFDIQGDLLASELLVHCANNKTLDSTYTPTMENLYRIKASKTWTAIRKGSGSSGSGTFEKSESEDLYYAIHLFNWTRTANYLKFEDRYDFGPGDYNGLANTAINAMYHAQQAGELVPFYHVFYEQV